MARASRPESPRVAAMAGDEDASARQLASVTPAGRGSSKKSQGRRERRQAGHPTTCGHELGVTTEASVRGGDRGLYALRRVGFIFLSSGSRRSAAGETGPRRKRRAIKVGAQRSQAGLG
jgi:hypothetical protein